MLNNHIATFKYNLSIFNGWYTGISPCYKNRLGRSSYSRECDPRVRDVRISGIWPPSNLYHIADQLGIKLILIYLKAPAGVVYERLKGRSERTDPEDNSSAHWQVYQKMSAAAEPIKRNHFVVDTSRDISPAIAKVVREMKRWIRRPGQ